MVKFAALVPHIEGELTLQIRTRPRVVAGFAVFQFSDPVFEAFLMIVFHVAPPSRESWTFTKPLTPLLVQRTVCLLPIRHTSPPFGAAAAMNTRGMRTVNETEAATLVNFPSFVTNENASGPMNPVFGV